MITTSHAFAPSVNARVAGSGIHRRILYTVKPVPGQRVVFIERSNQVLRQLGAARGRTGSIPFTATPGPQRRQILANVYEQGTPGPALTVASYQPPQRMALAAVRRIRIHRSGARATLSWATVPHATTYDVRVVLSDGDRHFYITRVPGVRIAGVFLEIGGRVTVRAEGDSVYTLTGRSHTIALPAAVHYPRGGIRTRLTTFQKPHKPHRKVRR